MYECSAGDLREKGQQGGDLVADHLGGMAVTVVHQGDALVPVHGGAAQGELRAAHGVGLHADAENLALDAGLDPGKIIPLGEDFVNPFFIEQILRRVPGKGTIRKSVCPADFRMLRSWLHRRSLTNESGWFKID